jgi:hypothetical protein
MTSVAPVAAHAAATSPRKAQKGLFRRLLDVLAEAQMRQAERELRRFRHLHDASWESDADHPRDH